MPARSRLAGLLAVALLAGPAVSPGVAARLRLRADAGETCAATTGRCAAVAGVDGRCHVTLRLCLEGRARRGLARVRLHGTRDVVAPLTRALAAMPNAIRARAGIRFRPPLPVGCGLPAGVSLAGGGEGSISAAGRIARGRRMGSALRVACEARSPGTGGSDPGAPPLRFSRTVVDPDGGDQLTSDVALGDLDGDGRPDLVVAGFARLLWYRNPAWAPAVIAEGRHGAGATTVVRDVDGDGRADVVTGVDEPSRRTVWYRNGAAGFERVLLQDDTYCHDLVFGDLDGDRRDDAVCVDQFARRIGWLAARPDPRAPWSYAVIDPDRNAMGAAIADVDRDGRADVVAGRSWYRNTPDGTWTRTVLTDVEIAGYSPFRDYAKVSVLDANGDGRPDVAATLYAETPVGRLYVFLAPPDPLVEPWTTVLVDAGPLFGVHSQGVAAFDGSPRPQIMVGETNIGGFGFGVAPDPHVAVYRLLGRAEDPSAWERTAIDAVGTHEAQVADVDGDGRPDVVGHEENTDQIGRFGAVHLWRNETVAATAAGGRRRRSPPHPR
jgi:hypothetical protein